MKADTWKARCDDLKRRIGEKAEAERKRLGGVGPKVGEIVGSFLDSLNGIDALKPGNIDGLRRIAERWGFTFDESRGAWKEIGRSV
jgi:endonuclease III